MKKQNDFSLMRISVFCVLLSIITVSMKARDTAQIWKKYIGELEDEAIPLLPDYSYAGYKLGEEAIPHHFALSTFDVTDYGAVANDAVSDQTAIQAAIDAAEESGGGIVFFPPGEYLVNTDPDNTAPIVINASNIILRGSGSAPGGTVINMRNYMRLPAGWSNWDNNPMFIFSPANWAEERTTHLDANAARGDFSIKVKDASVFQNEKYCKLTMKGGRNATWKYLDWKTPRKGVWSIGDWTDVVLEEVHEIDYLDLENNIIHLKDPVIDDIDTADGNWNDWYRWTAQTTTLIENCGFEDIHFKANFTDKFVHHADYIHDYAWHAIRMAAVAHSWVRRTRFTNVTGAMKITASSYASSIQNILVDGNSGHSLTIVDGGSSRILQGLIWDNTRAGQWHGVDMSGRACGNVVWRVDARTGKGIDLHGSCPRTNLVDSYLMMNKTGHGAHYQNLPNHLTWLTMWNVERIGNWYAWINFWQDCGNNYCSDLTVVNPIIVGYHGGGGTGFDAAHLKYQESTGAKVSPESLYQAQLAHRIGAEPLWVSEALSTWDSLRVAWYDADVLEPAMDAFVRSGDEYRSWNYGSWELLEVQEQSWGYERRAFLCFDLSGVQDFTAATLQLTPKTPGHTPYELRLAPNGHHWWWETGWESQLTHNNKPGDADLLMLGEQEGGSSAPLCWDVSGVALSEKSNHRFLTLEVRAANNAVWGSFYSKEHPNPDFRPKLIFHKKDTALAVLQDAYVRNGDYADNNYNTDLLEIKQEGWNYDRGFYLQFDLSGIATEIASAKVRLFIKDLNPGVAWHKVKHVEDDTWDEESVTWNNGPSASGEVLEWQPVVEGDKVVSWDVTATAEAERQTEDGLLSLRFSSDNDVYAAYHSHEATDPRLQPVLELVLKTYPVTFSVSGSNGSLSAAVDDNAISPGTKVKSGKSVVFSAEADAAYKVKEWLVNGNPVLDNTSNTYICEDLSADLEVKVSFEQDEITEVKGKSTEAAHFSLYPNPGSDYIYVKSPDEEKRISIYALTGRVIKQMTTHRPIAKVPISELLSGIYLIKVNKCVQKLMINGN